jgi:drug/metabolite transporter (DMT)-like permease
MGMATLVALANVGVQGGFHWPDLAAGWWGLVALAVLYGSGFTLLFTLLPRLGVAGNSAIMNVEPVCALVLAWLILAQSIAPVQVVGALIVVGAVIALGLRKKQPTR